MNAKNSKLGPLQAFAPKNVRKALVLTCFAGLALPFQGWAQGTTATLGGTVTDPTGAIIPKAQILLKKRSDGRSANLDLE